MDLSKKKYNPDPRESANLLETLFFTYTFGIFKKGYRKVLDEDDLYDLAKRDKTIGVHERLERNWNDHLLKCSTSKRNPSLLKLIIKTFWLEYLIQACLGGLHIFFQLTKPIMLGLLLTYFRPSSTTTKTEALWYAGGIVISSSLAALFYGQYNVYCFRCGMIIRAAVSALIYKKVFRLSKTALDGTASGNVVNLLSNDISRFDSSAIFIHYLWLAPCAALFVTYFLYREAGLAGILGLLVFFLFLPWQLYSGKLSAKYRSKTAAKTDERVRLMDEVISGVQVIKMYAWEKPFEKLIKYSRREELKVIRRSLFMRALIVTISHVTTRINVYLTVLNMVIMGQKLTADKVFAFTFYYNILSETVSLMFVRGIGEVAEFMVSIRRIQSFLLKEENSAIVKAQSTTEKYKLVLKDLTVKWNISSKEYALKGINLNIIEGKLIGIIGPVGCGKSTLLHAILGELEVTAGDIELNGTISYASQEPWVFAATIRQNIIFDSEYDKERYNQVVAACALLKDFKQFNQGDLTIVGEKGASLSGGQKARINLARALYRQADIYLLDDPLSAVDIHVSKHLYDKCIDEYLAGKTKILVTHQVQLLKDADHIVILKNGSIENEGNFQELSKSDNVFAKLLTLESESKVTGETNETQDIDTKTDRKQSLTSQKSHESKEDEDKDVNEEVRLLDLREESSKGKTKGSILLHYLNYGGNIFVIGFVMLLFILAQTATNLVDFFVSYWINVEEFRNISNISNKTNELYFEMSYSHWPTMTYLYIYTGILAFLCISFFLRSIFFFKLTVWSSQKLHDTMFNSVVSAPMRFFDTNPSGRILNRFSKDIGYIDEALPKTMMDSVQSILMVTGSLILVVIVNPIFLIFIIIISVPCLVFRRIYLKSSKNLKRLEGMMRSPIYTHINATLQGLTTIRAFGAQNILSSEFYNFLDGHNSSWFMGITSSFAFILYLNILCIIFLVVITFSFLTFGENVGLHSGEVGLSITQANLITMYCQWAILMSSEVITQLLSVERVLEYKSLPVEKQPEIPKQPPKSWPDMGEIKFEGMSLKYSDEAPLTLKNINFLIKPKEKVGIVGRTGAGKSSLIASLFRLTHVEGVIKIDNIDTKDVSLLNLRSKMSIIPQDPVLFSGSLRYNLDPFEEFSDDVLYKAIENVELNDPANKINKLENKVLDRGSNYSVGQRQLVCLARAIIRNNKILILDEATANVDPQTDALIQNTIRKQFADCTVLTIAHRLNTIMDSDKVMVIESGTLMEFDHPHILLQNPDGVFFKMVEETGQSLSLQLRKVAQENFQKHYSLAE